MASVYTAGRSRARGVRNRIAVAHKHAMRPWLRLTSAVNHVLREPANTGKLCSRSARLLRMRDAAPITLSDIRAAAQRIADGIVRTRFIHSHTLSEITGAEIWLKLENLQFTASFKERGAANKLLTLTQDEKKRGVIAMSAGNHAQAVAYHAQ